MKRSPDDTPIACRLSATELGKREATLLARFLSGVIATEELSNGYVFSFPGDGKWISLLADLMLAERECCPFLTFELAAQPDMGPLVLRVIGPTGAKELLRTILCDCEASL